MSPTVSYERDGHHERPNLTHRRRSNLGTPISSYRANETAEAPNGPQAPSRSIRLDLWQPEIEVKILLRGLAAYIVSFNVLNLLSADITDRGIWTVRQRSCRDSRENEKLLPTLQSRQRKLPLVRYSKFWLRKLGAADAEDQQSLNRINAFPPCTCS